MATTFDLSTQVLQIFSAKLAASEAVKFLASRAYTIIHVSFYNIAAGAYTAAGSIDNAGSTVVSSSADLGATTVEEKESGDLSNITVADGATVTITAGDQISYIVVTCYPTYTA